jgi:hypothetical protein
MTVKFGCSQSICASVIELVTMVSSRSTGKAVASRETVLLASSRIAPSSGTSASAAIAIRSFSIANP